ncbi:hypothetical protein GHT06_016943 [Daphnia sinensis]|uniref:Reverse transcriptase domain-containing protein n=1 Tax=Daphnia sinensis TaxID=1820382 RepID=A0AAD5KP78_9CRUS|nr:hypothetical protein GHT06_016943 [Daphnia sinensis]
MAFGLCNAPATFQRLMNYVLRDVLGSKALVYLDDVIIFSDTFENHLEDIREIFNLLKAANLKLKLKKCQFVQRAVNYLGHVISTDGIKPDPGKVDKIVNYKTPTSVDEVRSFLGLAGYYRRFIKDFGSIAKPDHRPLQWLKNQKDNNGRLGRWAILLAATNYELKYRPGRIHQNADCLSRLKVASIQPVPNNIKLICEKQLEDELCVDIRNYLEKGELNEKYGQSKPDWAKEIAYFEIIEGTLYRHELPSKDIMSSMPLLLLLCLLYLRARAFQTTVCDCAEPLNMGIIQFPDADCNPKMNSTSATPVRYVVYSDERAAVKFPGFICAKWRNIHRVTMSFFGQTVIVPEKIPIDTTASECYHMINTKKCEGHEMTLSDEKYVCFSKGKMKTFQPRSEKLPLLLELSVNATFETVITPCGPQPKFNNYTINLDGWELVKFSPCYWTNGFVNFNDKPYVFRNNTWKRIDPNIVLPERTLAHSFRYEDVKAFDYDHRSNPAYNDNLLNHMNVVADIVAAMNEHSPVDFPSNHRPHAADVLLTAAEVGRYTSWWEVIIIALVVTVIFILVLIALRICCCLGLFGVCCPPIKEVKTSHLV